MSVTALVGAQYGSEGKGVVAHYYADDYTHWVRTGGPNAGHSFVHDGTLWKMRCLPCGFVNQDAMLILGPGAVVCPNVLLAELKEIEDKYDKNIRSRVIVDSRATPLLGYHRRKEGSTKGDINQRIGSTGEGVGAARIDWMERDVGMIAPFGQYAAEKSLLNKIQIHPRTDELLHTALTQTDTSIMLEATQGFGLSLTHGNWPYVTSSDTTAGQLAVDAGVAPRLLTNVIMVARTYPIRVAGNSGPLKDETDWQKMSLHVGKPVTEQTTVTGLTRRIGGWDEDLMRRACIVNGPTGIVLTFMDYMSPEDEYKIDFTKLSARSRSFIDYVERYFETPVVLIGTGFTPTEGWTCVDRRD